MEVLRRYLGKYPIFYVTRDIERALGLRPAKGYSIIANATPFAKQAIKGRSDTVLIDGGRIMDTRELLANTVPLLGKERRWVVDRNPDILVFKNTGQIEDICRKNNWRLLNPSSALANRVEEKISQVEWLGDLERYLPPHRIDVCKNVRWEGRPFILQFNRAHTGGGTALVESMEQAEGIRKKFPNRPVRISEYISGPVFTNNNIVAKDAILVGNISYQITGLAPFTDQPFATIGNDWGLSNRVLSTEQKVRYREIAATIGEKLRADGWKGLFGIDVIMDEKTGKPYLLEINARQPASTTCESQLQQFELKNGRTKELKNLMTTFEAHLIALLDLPTTGRQLIEIADGAQIVYRVQQSTKNRGLKSVARSLTDFTLIPYPNTAPGNDLLRIQSKTSVMEGHGQFNAIGEAIKRCFTDV